MNLSNDILPIRFTISEHAKTVIMDAWRASEDHHQQTVVAASVSWAIYHPNNDKPYEGLFVGYYAQSQYDQIAHAIQDVCGIPLVLFTIPEYLPYFTGKVLDHDPERGYFLRDP